MKARIPREAGLRLMFECSPDKNVSCNKKNCILTGGTCNATANKLFAKWPLKKVHMQLPTSEDDYKTTIVDSVEKSSLSAQIEEAKREIEANLSGNVPTFTHDYFSSQHNKGKG